MKVAAAYFREKAELLRRLAGTLGGQHDQVATQLRRVADEFDANADVLEARIAREAENATHQEQNRLYH